MAKPAESTAVQPEAPAEVQKVAEKEKQTAKAQEKSFCLSHFILHFTLLY